MFARKTTLIVATLLVSTAVTAVPALVAQAQPNTPPTITLPPGAAGLAINPPANAATPTPPPVIVPPVVVQGPPVAPPSVNRQIGVDAVPGGPGVVTPPVIALPPALIAPSVVTPPPAVIALPPPPQVIVPPPALIAPPPPVLAQPPSLVAPPAIAPPPAAVAAAGTPGPIDDVPEPMDGMIAPLAAGIEVPTDPIALAAFSTLMQHCARCHQEGMLIEYTEPQDKFGNILHLAELAADPRRITPGFPDASKLITEILDRKMPHDVYGTAFNSHFPPAPTEVQVAALRTWVESLGGAGGGPLDVAGGLPNLPGACEDGRPFITPTQMVEAMDADLARQLPTRVLDTRYITLTNIYNACASLSDMDVYRKAVIKLLNSLSMNSDIVRLETVDEYQTIIRFNLRDVAWDTADWDKILSIYPYATRPSSFVTRRFDSLATATASALPYIRGDWFGFTASKPPLYETLLGLPTDYQGLTASLNLDINANINSGRAIRAGFQNSGVSNNNRLIERHAIQTGYFWTSYDFAGDADKQSIMNFPLGPTGGGDDTFAFHHDGGESIWSLPNGLQAYGLYTAAGKPLAFGPTQIVQDPAREDFTVTNGISCMGCHAGGIKFNRDEVRNYVLNTNVFPPGVRALVDALYPAQEQVDAVMQEDQRRFYQAMIRAGLQATDETGTPLFNPQTGEPLFPTIGNARDMIEALADNYEQEIDARRVAAEFGIAYGDFQNAILNAGTSEAVLLNQQLQQGDRLIPRTTFQSQYHLLAPRVAGDELIVLATPALPVPPAPVPPPPPANSPAAVPGNFNVELVSNQTVYALNDRPVFTVTTTKDCYLTLINVDSKGTATVLLPNAFQSDNFVTAGKPFLFPGAGAGFSYRMQDYGLEQVIAICNVENTPVDNIAHNFAAAPLTVLGNYEAYVGGLVQSRGIDRAIVIDQAAAAAAAPAGAPIAAVAPPPPAPSTTSRAAIQLTVQ